MDIDTGQVPRWDLADRLRKSLRQADVSVQEMADYLEVSRNTISNWINGHTRPSAGEIRLWALRTQVPYGWLRKGEIWIPTAGGIGEVPPDGAGQLRKQLLAVAA